MSKTPVPSDAGPRVNQILLGKYRIEKILGQGGMGVVARCTHLALNEQVAIKMLRADIMLDADVRERFMREGRAAARLKSEHVARVTDVGTFENNVPYMVMEFLDGHDLGELIARGQRIPIPWAAELILQAAEALGEAHSIGIVHRDVKPTNLFVTWRPDGSAIIKVLDFGISKASNDTDLQLTQTQSVLGTPAYMSPEQMRSAKLVDERSDIWSLGSVMYELFEGRRPFEAESFSEMCVKVSMDPPGPMVHTPPELQPIVMRCLAKPPEQRYQTMAELARDLIPFTQNPQQAMVIVERMHRLAGRRSSADLGEHLSRPYTPVPVRDYGSAPMVVPGGPWARGSEPSGLTFPNTPPGGVPRYTQQDGSAPVVMPGAATPRTRGLRLALFAVALAGVGVGVGLALGLGASGDDDDAPPAQIEPAIAPADKPEDKPADKPVEPTADKPVEPPVDKPVEPPVDKPAGEPAAVPAVADEPEIEIAPPEPAVVKKKPPVKKPPASHVPKKDPIKEPPPKAHTPAPPVKVKKDPFDSPR